MISREIERRDTAKGREESTTRKKRARFLLSKCRRAFKEMLELRIVEMPDRGRISYLKGQVEILEHRAEKDPERFFV